MTVLRTVAWLVVFLLPAFPTALGPRAACAPPDLETSSGKAEKPAGAVLVSNRLALIGTTHPGTDRGTACLAAHPASTAIGTLALAWAYLEGKTPENLPAAPPAPSEQPEQATPPAQPPHEEKPSEAQAAEAKPAEVKAVPDAENSCIQCHETLTEKDQERVLVNVKEFVGDAHWAKGLRCQNCHGGDPTVFEIKAHQANNDFRVAKSPSELREFCGRCHKQEALELVKGVHDKAGTKDSRGQGTPLTCSQCHGDRPQRPAHHVLPARDSQSPVFLDNQVKKCGQCHEEYLETYMKSVHGQGLSKMGLLVVPACANCHGAHGVYRAPDKRSTLHPTHVAATCGKCHRFIEERLQASVHGHGAGGLASRNAPGGNGKNKPSCTSCHQGHDLLDPLGTAFRLQLPNRCGSCHVTLSSRYAMSLHGALTALGYGPAAKCSDCHGAHDVLPVDNPQSMLAGDNRVNTCKKCHPNANRNFSQFDPHADPSDAQANPILHRVFQGMEILLYSVFGFFGAHTLLWFARSLIHALRHGRPKRLAPRQRAYLRFESFHRLLHVVVIVSFLGLALTGLPLKYNHENWAKSLASAMGGFDNTSTLHRFCALATIFYASAHLVWLGRKFVEMLRQGVPLMTVVFGADSPVPNLRDVKDFFRMVGWFFGLAKKPVFERWTYWEKFDYWAVFWGVGIIGTSGLMLWFPNFFTLFLPGGVLNGAKLIHSEEALLATGFIFAIHFFNTHFRAEKFPLDMVIFTGAVGEEELQEERPEYLDRMRHAGKLEQLRTTMPSRTRSWLIMLGGILALTTGLALLVAMVLAGLGH